MKTRKENSLSTSNVPFAHFLFTDTRFAVVWLVFRLYVGYAWLEAGWGKVTKPVWVGDKAGTALTGFVNGALAKTDGLHPDVQSWYADFLKNVVLNNVEVFSYMVAFGEVAVGVALILGLFTGLAAFFGAFMNLNFLLAGTVSTNPILLIIQVFLVMAWRVAGWLGLDRFILPYFVRFLRPEKE